MKTLLKIGCLGIMMCFIGCSGDDSPKPLNENNTGIIKYVVDTNKEAFFVTFLDETNLRKTLYIEDSHWEYSFEGDSEIVYVLVNTYEELAVSNIKIYFNEQLIDDIGCSGGGHTSGQCFSIGKTR